MERVADLQDETETDISLQAAMDQALAQMDLDQADLQTLRTTIITTIEHEYGADAAQLSLWSYDHEEDLPGGDVIFPDGYDAIATFLARGLDVRLGHQVLAIDYGDDTVQVETDQGSFSADQVVVTLPLGVLQKGSVTFTPALPAQKRAAITDLGMGLLDKLYLRFPAIFWPTEPEVLNFLGNGNGEWAEWLNIAHYTGKPVLLGFNASRIARPMESRTDAEIVASAMQVLRTAYGPQIPDPDSFRITRWAQDPFALGLLQLPPPRHRPGDDGRSGRPRRRPSLLRRRSHLSGASQHRPRCLPLRCAGRGSHFGSLTIPWQGWVVYQSERPQSVSTAAFRFGKHLWLRQPSHANTTAIYYGEMALPILARGDYGPHKLSGFSACSLQSSEENDTRFGRKSSAKGQFSEIFVESQQDAVFRLGLG